MKQTNISLPSFSKWYMLVPQFSFFLRVVTANNTGLNMSLFIHLVCNHDMKAERNVARLPAWLDHQSVLIVLWDFMPSERQINIVKAKFLENQYKHRWDHYSIAITLSSHVIFQLMRRGKMSIASLTKNEMHEQLYSDFSWIKWSLKSTRAWIRIWLIQKMSEYNWEYDRTFSASLQWATCTNTQVLYWSTMWGTLNIELFHFMVLDI